MDERFHRAHNPLVEQVVRLWVDDLLVRKPVDVRVGDEERIRVPPRDQEVAHQLLDALLGELERLGLHDRRVDHVETDGVRSIRVEHLRRVGIVLEALRHLLAVLGENEAVDDHVLVRRLVEEARAQDHERIEPAARLVQALGDEVGREVVLEVALAHVVLLRVRHRAGLEPAVEDLGRAMIRLAVLLDDDLVDEVLVEIRHLLARKLLELLDRADADHVGRIVVVDPHRDAAAPEAVAGDVPVARLLEPVAEALLADVFGRPVHLRVVLRETLVEILDADVPGVDRAVDEGRVGAVAERIRVGDRRLVDELALGLEALDDVLVAVLAEAPLVLGDLGRERAARVQRIDDRLHPGLLADAEVVLAVRRRDVDDADAVVGGDVVVVEDLERALGLLVREVREDRLVARALELRALKLGDELVLLLLLEERRQPRLRHDVNRLRLVGDVANRDIVDRRARAHHQVLRERPRRRRPDEEIDGRLGGEELLHRLRLGRERLRADGDRRVLDVLVVRARLEVGKRRRELPRIRHDAVRLVDAALLPELTEHPPDRLHELGVHRLVVVVEVDPAAHARHGLAPLVDVLEDLRAAVLVELVDTERLDLGRTGDAEVVLGDRLDRKPVRIPAETTLDILAAHRLVTRDDVLDRSGQQVPVVRQARSERRAVVELVTLLALVPLQGLFKRLLRLPNLEDLLLHLRECDLVGHRLEHNLMHLSKIVGILYQNRRILWYTMRHLPPGWHSG